MTSEKRIKLLQNLGIVTLILLSMKYLYELFGNQLSIFFGAVNTIVLPLGIALFISYLLAPIVMFIEKRLKVKYRWLSISIVYILMIAAFALFVYLIGNLIYTQAVIFFQTDWSNIIIYIEDQINNNQTILTAYESISKYITFDTVSPVFFNVFSIFKGITGIIITIVLVPVFLFFLLNDKTKIFEGIISVLPKKRRIHLRELGKRANIVIEKYFNGRFISMSIMSVIFTIMFYILGFGVKSIFFGFFLGFLDIVPYVGGFVGMLFPILFSFTISDELMFNEYTFVAIIIGNFSMQFVQGNLLQPIIMGREVDLHPLLVLSSFIFFGALFGVTGIILAIPITGIIKTSFEYFGELKEENIKF